MKKKNKKNLLIITPVNQLDGFLDRARDQFNLIKYLPNPSPDQVIRNIKNIDYIFTNPNMSKFTINKKILNKGKNLKCICTASTGTNHIDLNYCKKKKIRIISLRKNTKLLKKIPSTAELAFTLMMASLRNIYKSSSAVLNFKWSYLNFIGNELNKKKIGILGYGRLGKYFARYCKSFGAEIFFYDPFKKQNDKKIRKIFNLNKFLKMLDILSIHIHLDKKNKNFLDANKLNYLKKNILIINTSRGEIINEKDLIHFMKKNIHSKFAADVISNELGNVKSSKLIKFYRKNTHRMIITPHLGGSTIEAQTKAYFFALNQLEKLDKNYVK